MSALQRRRSPGEGKDLESSLSGDEYHSSSTALDNVNLTEYAGLERYISTYRESNAGLEDIDDEDDEDSKKAWWQFWKSSSKSGEPSSSTVMPDAWFETEIARGIRSSDVEERRKLAGWNELSAEKENHLLKFIGFFRGPILYVMEAAAILAAGMQDWIDFGVILAILLLNAFVGFYQEKQAADIVASLKGDIAMRCTVVRDGKEENILARELVPGDIIVIQEGDTVPADARLICDYERPQDAAIFKQLRNEDKLGGVEEKEFDEEEDDSEGHLAPHRSTPISAVDQSAITGESLAVEKYLGDVVYYTTGCKRGKSYAVVTATAKGSFVGRTAELVQGAKDQGHFKAVMNNIGTTLLILVLFFILAVWIGGFFHHMKIATPEHHSLLQYALILLIIGVPVGLPVVTTTTLAVGAAYLAKQKAIVQNLTAIESLAGVDILCSDKTGTLTANKLSMRDPWLVDGQDVNWMMAVAGLASSHNFKTLDPIDKMTLLSLKKFPKAREILQQGWITEKFTPFDPVSKKITAICRLGDDVYTCVKGAPKTILKLSNCSEAIAEQYKAKDQEFARRGFRCLGVAYKKNDGDWILLGLLSLFDPPREDTAQTIIEAAQLGVPVKMLTGDAIAIAKETCRMLALGTKVYNSEKLIGSGLAGSVQHDFVERADGFAEVFPEHKYRVVEMLQQRGHLTAMTGDGVNDAPSLKKADCGIAVEGSSEAAQAAADIVFLAPGLSTIVLAIKTSRKIFQRMKAYIEYRIALCLHLEIYLALSMIIMKETVRVDLIVFLALFSDLATVAIAYDNAHYEPRPVEWQLKKIWVVSVILGCLLAAGTWIIRGTLLLNHGGIVQNYGSVQEILFLQIALTENWLIFVTRGSKTFPSWQLIGAIFAVDVLATIFCVFGWMSGHHELSTKPGHWSEQRNGWTDIVTVVLIWLYSFGVIVVISIIYFILNQMEWLNNLGRKDRKKKDSLVENFIGQLTKLSIEHDLDGATGKSRYLLTEKSNDHEDD